MIKQKACELEPQTVRAVKSNVTSEEIFAHLNSCANCREAAKVAAFFQANLKDETPRLPAAGFVWWKSKIIEKRRRQERVAQPILAAQIAAAAVFFAALVWLLTSESVQSESLAAVAASVKSFVVPFAVGVVCVAVACLFFSLTLRRYFSDK